MGQRHAALDGRGPAVNAIAALDMALWDLRAKLANVNVSGLLGTSHTSLPVYDSGSYANALETALDEKLKAYYLSPRAAVSVAEAAPSLSVL